MLNEIEIGEYVRTDRGIIAKMIGYDDDNNIMLDIQQILTKIESKKVKHSKKIIDLIEEGDYVNGYKVKEEQKVRIVNIKNEQNPRNIKKVLKRERGTNEDI